MQILTEKEILKKIKKEDTFEATILDGSLTIKVENYVPCVCTAIHNGHKLRADLLEKCALSEAERIYEEDPYTAEFISSTPITLIAEDSRYEYDLNRNIDECTYESAWGKAVWRKPLDAGELQASRDKHHQFYRVFHALISKLESRFKACVVYDVHSYNYQKLKKTAAPTFNIGTSQVDSALWEKEIAHLEKNLGRIELPNLEVSVARNDVFQGRGYMATYVKENFRKTLILPTEIKKVFMDEDSGKLFPLVMPKLKAGLKHAITLNAAYFSRRHTTQRSVRKNDLLASNIEPVLKKVDKALYHIARGIETLLYINPLNLQHERKRFFSGRYRGMPDYKYRQLNIDPYLFRENLYRLPVDDIKDISIQNMYRQVIDGYAEKIDLLTSIGTEHFFYNSLKYYGEPDPTDIDNARFILYAADMEDEEAPLYDAQATKNAFESALKSYGFNCRIELSSKIIAGAMVNNVKKTIMINKRKVWTEKDLRGLIHHELGVHMVTSVNADKQPLKIFKLGLPGNTHTQEGLAILSEYLSGNLTLSRLKTLALRVLSVNMLAKKHPFSQTFEMLMDEYGLDRDKAFDMATRAYRGGGFTKDYLYLKGMKHALYHFKNKDITGLYVGKTSFKFLNLINELISRKILIPPTYIPEAHRIKPPENKILDYIISSIR